MKRGFTLLELLIVITIVVILAAAIMPLFKSSRLETEILKCRTDLEAAAVAGRVGYLDIGVVPNAFTLHIQNITFPGWNGPYLDREARDPWGKVFVTKGEINGSIEHKYYVSSGPNKIYESGGGDDIMVHVEDKPYNP